MAKRVAPLFRSCVVVLVALAAVACESDSESGRASADADWASFQIDGDEAEGFATLDELARSADGVVRGSFSEQLAPRIIRGDAAEDIVYYAQGVFSVESSHTKEAPKTLIVEFLSLKDAALPIGEDVLLFIREKSGAGERGLYRIVNSTGLWIEGKEGVMAPLYEGVEEGEVPYQDQVDGVATLDELSIAVEEATATR